MKLSDKHFRIFALCVIAGLVVIALVNLYQAKQAAPSAKILSYSMFLDEVGQGEIRSVIIAGRNIRGSFTDHTAFRTYAADDPDLVKLLRQKGVSITATEPPDSGHSWLGVLGTLLPMILLVAVALFFMSRMPGAGGRAMGLGKSKAKLLTPAPGPGDLRGRGGRG